VRIPVKRRDQVGELQRSFNGMTQELEQLVATAAEKEVLEKELEIARELQRSLLPRELPGGEAVEFSTLFAPSAAIGGDYFDVLGLGDGRLAVVIADVSGHGLSAGLRMAMLKAGLLILVEERHEPAEILRRLDGLVRSSDERRAFVTATLSLLDVRRGTLDITNAGHPPAYHRRGDDVEEIVLPGPPLGRLGRDYGRRRLELEPGDLVVWLSDGLIEATSPAGDPFGYERVRQTIAAAPATPAAVREHLLAAVAAHTGGKPPEDDRTLVVLRYSRPG
jgi:sigma-B regulation protein RsbU (phosphoserine phosphatase)